MKLLFPLFFVVFFVVLCFSQKRVEAAPQAELCFQTPEGEELARAFDGIITITGRYVGRTGKGCIRYEKNYCGLNEEVIYKPKDFPESNLFFSFQIDSCRDNQITFNAKQWEILQLLQENIDLQQINLPETNPFQASELKVGCAPDEIKECLFLNSIRLFYRLKKQPKADSKILFLQLLKTLQKENIDAYRINDISEQILFACGPDPVIVREGLVENLIYRQELSLDQDLPPKSHFAFQEIWPEKKEVSLSLKIDSEQKISFFLLPGYQEYEKFLKGQKINYSPECSFPEFSQMEGECSAIGQSMFLLVNSNSSSVRFRLHAQSKFSIGDTSSVIVYYSVHAGKSCIATDLNSEDLLSVGIRFSGRENRFALDPYSQRWFEPSTQIPLTSSP